MKTPYKFSKNIGNSFGNYGDFQHFYQFKASGNVISNPREMSYPIHQIEVGSFSCILNMFESKTCQETINKKNIPFNF